MQRFLSLLTWNAEEIGNPPRGDSIITSLTTGGVELAATEVEEVSGNSSPTKKEEIASSRANPVNTRQNQSSACVQRRLTEISASLSCEQKRFFNKRIDFHTQSSAGSSAEVTVACSTFKLTCKVSSQRPMRMDASHRLSRPFSSPRPREFFDLEINIVYTLFTWPSALQAIAEISR